MEAQVRQISPGFPLSGLMLLIIGGIIGFIIFLVLSIIGGLIAVPIFEKRKGTRAPPPPQGFGAIRWRLWISGLATNGLSV